MSACAGVGEGAWVTVTLAAAVRKLSVDTVSVSGLKFGSCGLRLNTL
jgi:hypothetical protein